MAVTQKDIEEGKALAERLGVNIAETVYSCGHAVFFCAVHSRKHSDPDECPECRK